MEIAIPSTWEDRSTYTFIAPREKARIGPRAQDDGFRSNVVVTVGPEGKADGLDAATKRAIAQVRDNFGEVAIEIENGPEISGQPSRRLSYRIIEPGGALALFQAQYLVEVDRTERIFTFTTAAVNAKSMLPAMEQMIQSVHVRAAR